MSLDRSKKTKMLVVDDEPDNLDLLYRTFRRDFHVLRAESGVAALEMLAAEGEVAVIISDQRMPEMKGTEFLSKTVPQFPDTMRIILTGFTDVEDLVDAINSGQVYKYITKPWDPNELKAVVQRAAETYELLKQRTEELRWAQVQTSLLNRIVSVAHQSSQLEDTLVPIAQAFGETFAADCTLQLLNGSSFGAIANFNSTLSSLSDDPLAKEAIATRATQAAPNIAADPALAGLGHYGTIQSHCVTPIIFRQEAMALLSLQWQQPHALTEEELGMLQLAAQQVGMALTCARQSLVAA
jgi:CheY-like chemotaxis protein